MPSVLSVVMPVLNEAAIVRDALERLQPLRMRGAELIVVDGGSADATPALAAPLADRVVRAARGRAAQMNAGAALARGDVLLFLHADSCLPADADRLVAGHAWGRFDVRIDSRSLALRLVASMMNLRSRATGIATGDQAIFATADFFHQVGGFPEIALMEDIAFSACARRLARPACLRERVTTSARRWEKHGVLRTILLMWRLRLAYFMGADPAELARRYAQQG
ncbi:MAG: TIGR04283 family arsenosugar biosynthesis glycosyltransferase [Burkholderiales bacterium]